MPFTTIAGQSLATQIVPLLEPERSILRESFGHRDSGHMRAAAHAAYERLESRLRTAIDGSGMTPACHRGCSWCCRGVKVNVTAFEALVIAEDLKEQDSPLREAVHAAAERRRSMNTNQLFESGDVCPFLGTAGQCQIYAVRPAACRRHYCMDDKECARAISNPKLKLAVTQHAPANVAGALSAMAWAAAMEDAQLDYRTFELATGVNVALRDGTTERWLKGEKVFDSALREVDHEDQAILRADL